MNKETNINIECMDYNELISDFNDSGLKKLINSLFYPFTSGTLKELFKKIEDSKISTLISDWNCKIDDFNKVSDGYNVRPLNLLNYGE